MTPHDIAAALGIEAPVTRRGVDLRWLGRSQRAPRGFFHALYGVLSQVAALGPNSDPARGFDLYHDMVVRHIGAGRTALRCYDPIERRWLVLSFDELHARCSLRAGSWTAHGVEPGAIVGVVAPFGVECIVSLLTGLRLGACVSLLEPGGPDYLAVRLAALAPQFIAIARFHWPLLGDLDALGATLLGEDDLTARPREGSHTYLPFETCALLFSPLRQSSLVPVAVASELAYFGALRDGAASLALRPGDQLAAPGFDIVQHQPALLFAALLLGATFVHIDEAPVIDDPGLLGDLPLRSLGLTAAVRDALLDGRSGARPAWAHLFKNPEEPCDWQAWREFVELLEFDDTPMSNLLIEAASGGALLSSPRRPAKAQLAQLMDVTAAPGRAWTLLDFTGSDQPAVGEVGVFAPLTGVNEAGDEGAPDDPRYLVLGRRRGDEYLYGGTVEPRRCGRIYAMQEVLDTLADCPFLRGASVVAVVAGGPTLAWRFVLLGFTGAEPEPHFADLKQRRIDELRRVLSTRLTVDHLPDHIELFPGFARVHEGEVDHRWCREQYQSGLLFRKSRSPVFQHLTGLRGALSAVAAPLDGPSS